ncbi:MAG: pantoate--beta-alanine ligase [Anaerolineae bacterium SM23_ 63]|nr:MAG: pantoate--beta-alanine ligase [Anaerolineae bacterium SM23_ 63]
MKVVTTIAELRKILAALPKPLGLVPTMGYLHEGHLSLVRRARGECVSVVVSIFVNPTQFGENEDLSAYPRDLDRDFDLLGAEGADLVWTPTQEEIYPVGYQTWVTVENLSQMLEGHHRPGHFRGVTTVVAKLFNATQPDKAYFGQKDAQQAVVIRRMTEDLNFPLEVVVCPTLREPDGLAMSSRNTYLDPKQRQAATVVYRSLAAAVQAFETGERDAEVLRNRMSEVLSTEPLAEPQYVSVANPETLEELNGSVERALFSMAVYVGKTRLIDNVVVGD